MENTFYDNKKLNHSQHEPFYHNEMVDVYDLVNKISSEAIITSIRGNIFIVKYTANGQEEIIRNEDKIIIKQCIFIF